MMQDVIFQLVTVLIPLILAITVHEYAHVAVARLLGDDLGTRLGRFTLDPTKHIDPLWTVGLPAMLIVFSTLSGASGIPFFAAGKPAPYNPLALRRRVFGKRIPLKYAELLIAAAGPLSNIAMAIISILGVYILMRQGFPMTGRSIAGILMQFVYLNVALCVFNLIPIPPLDGSKVLVAFLPYRTAMKYEAIAVQLSWVLLGVLIFGGGQVIGYAVLQITRGMWWMLTG